MIIVGFPGVGKTSVCRDCNRRFDMEETSLHDNE